MNDIIIFRASLNWRQQELCHSRHLLLLLLLLLCDVSVDDGLDAEDELDNNDGQMMKTNLMRLDTNLTMMIFYFDRDAEDDIDDDDG